MSITEFDEGWILGFMEGEGSFTYDHVSRANNDKPIKIPRFHINQVYREPLEYLKMFFVGGKIYVRNHKGRKYWSENKSTRYDYMIRDSKTLEKLRNFCEGRLKHPGKIEDFKRWKLLFNNFLGEKKHRELSRVEMNKRWSDPKWREKRSADVKKSWANPKYRKKALAGLERIRPTMWTPEARQKHSELMKKVWANKKNLEKEVKEKK